MEELIATILKGIVEGTPSVIMGLGWLLYILERYYFQPKKEEATAKLIERLDEKLDLSRSNYQNLGEKMVDTLHKFSTLLEVIKDRQGRG